ncbi:MAG: polysaccharide biosynthesis tyrosine autokinase [Bacteroidales bacterium]|nr:polysaccharide biosynthesis tyrosine autokinase [Bacteroidales bacterium]
MENVKTTPNTAVRQDDSVMSIRDIWNLCISHWKWFVLSVLVCLTVAGLYILRSVPVYTRSSSVLIKEDRNSGSVSADIASAFSDLGLGQTSVNVNNELINFTSPDLMMQVVKNLNLDVNYIRDGFFHDYTLYGSSLPVRVRFLEIPQNAGAAMTVTPVDSATVRISDFVFQGNKVKGNTEVAYGDTLETAAGKIIVEPAEYKGTFDFPVQVYRSGFQAATRSCRGRLSAALNGKNTTVIDLNYRDVNTQRAEDVLRMIINVYNENWIKDKNQISISTNEFIADRLSIIEQELGNVDKTITTYRSEHRLPDYASAAQMDMQISAEAGKQLMELNNQLSIARYLQSDIRAAGSGALLPANVGLNDASTRAQIEQYNASMLQRNRLVESSSEENLLVKDLDTQLASLRGAVLTSLDNYVKALNVQIQSSQRVQSSSQARVSDIPLQAGQLLSDERQQKVKEALYLFLLQKREENELSQAFTAYATRVVASPSGPVAPIAPNKKMILLVALLLGLAIPFAWFYLKEVMDTTVRGRKDLENLSIPFIGELPSAYPKRKFYEPRRITDRPEDRKIVVKAHSRDLVNEAFRVARTNLEFVTGKQEGGKVLMVTSFNVGSGKTYVASNLATSLAIKGRKVIVVDLDLRKRSLSAFMGHFSKGVSDYLAGKTQDWRSLVGKAPGDSGLDIMPVGKVPPNPAELLSEPTLARLLDELKQHYDYVFLDCPPVEIVTDADLIAPNVDVTIFIVRAGLLERSLLPEMEKYYQAKRYKGMVLLLNGTDSTGRFGYKYGYKYGYGYGHYGSYGYGYGSESDSGTDTETGKGSASGPGKSA